MAIEVRSVGPEAFEEIHPLLLEFPSPRMSREDWRRMLFTYPWSDSACRGYALYADGQAVGYMGAIFSARPVNGRIERFCNTSSWIVKKEYRQASILLVRPILALRDHTIVNLTPSPVAYEIFAKLGMRPLESEQLILPPLPHVPDPRAAGARYTLSPDDLRTRLEGVERDIYRDLSSSPVAHHVLLERGGRRCYLVATLARKKGVPFAEVQYIGDRELFWSHRALAHAALVRSMGVAGLVLAVDARFAAGHRPRLALRRPARRLYRPVREDITPTMIDGLYSELMGLRL